MPISNLALAIALLAAAGLFALGAQADEAPSNLPPARYTFNRVDDGFLRLDNKTGSVMHCSQQDAGWVCRAVPEDRAALEQEIARLQDQVKSLQQEVATLRGPAEERPPKPVPDDSTAKLKLPSHEDIARARAFLEDTWRQLMDMLVHMQKEAMRKS